METTELDEEGWSTKGLLAPKFDASLCLSCGSRFVVRTGWDTDGIGFFRCTSCGERFSAIVRRNRPVARFAGNARETGGAMAEVKCPVCRGTVLAELAPSELNRRYQCGNAKCLEVFCVPRTDLTPGMDAMNQARREEAAVAKTDLDCPKCGKKYKRGGSRRDKHVAGCDGKKSESRRATPARGGSPLSSAIEDLRQKREDLIAGIPELREIDRAIAALEGVQGGGESLPMKRRRKDHDGSVEEDPDV